MTTKTGAVTLGLLEVLLIVFHSKVARSIFFAGIVSEKRYFGYYNINIFLPAKKRNIARITALINNS